MEPTYKAITHIINAILNGAIKKTNLSKLSLLIQIPITKTIKEVTLTIGIMTPLLKVIQMKSLSGHELQVMKLAMFVMRWVILLDNPGKKAKIEEN
jgi:hypothetical protein